MGPLQSRTERRAAESDVTRIRLLENDQDVSDDRHDRIEGKLNALIMIAIANVFTFGSASVLLAINIIRGA